MIGHQDSTGHFRTVGVCMCEALFLSLQLLAVLLRGLLGQWLPWCPPRRAPGWRLTLSPFRCLVGPCLCSWPLSRLLALLRLLPHALGPQLWQQKLFPLQNIGDQLPDARDSKLNALSCHPGRAFRNWSWRRRRPATDWSSPGNARACQLLLFPSETAISLLWEFFLMIHLQCWQKGLFF